MSLLIWSPMFSVGVKAIDDEHKKLIDLANGLSDQMGAGRGKEALGPLFADLIAYTQYHFSNEERLMGLHQYSASADHEQKHRELVESVMGLRTRFEKGEDVLTSEVMVFLRDWLTKHILQTDKALGRELNQKGVR